MAVKSYKWNDKTQLSPHFNVQEFRCKCGRQHDILVADELVVHLEYLFDYLGCSMITINSGYRCPSHDKAVGGSGSGYHVSGYAADIRCYDKKRALISSRLVSCAMQEVGFKGIANIDTSYVNTHGDVRPNGKWYGDEVVTTASSVCSDFWKYYGIAKPTSPATPQTTSPAAEPEVKKGDKGESVKSMQTLLFNKGYIRKNEIDGDFGRITLGALLAFQFENSLKVTGVCSSDTWAALKK